jgi:hypothetical protein
LCRAVRLFWQAVYQELFSLIVYLLACGNLS